jgi:hypothetical protein
MKTKELIEYLQGFDAESEVVVITANPKERMTERCSESRTEGSRSSALRSATSPIWIRKRSRQQYRMKERQSRNEFEIRKAK